MKYFYLSISLLFLNSWAFAENFGQDEYYGQGYTIIRETPVSPLNLKQPINKRIMANTINEGLQRILEGTGWRLSHGYANDPQLNSLLNSPWPVTWQWIGPDQLEHILHEVGGEGWQLVVDPVNRLIGYEIRKDFRKRKPTGAKG